MWNLSIQIKIRARESLGLPDLGNDISASQSGCSSGAAEFSSHFLIQDSMRLLLLRGRLGVGSWPQASLKEILRMRILDVLGYLAAEPTAAG